MIQIAEPLMAPQDYEALRQPLESGWLTQGPKVAEFERNFAAMHQVDHALAVTSCTTALHLALEALGIGEGDEVIVPSFTWVATANCAVYAGATPVITDVDPATYNIDVSQVAAKVTARTKAVIPVHLFGLCADIAALREVLPDHVAIIEDAACAAGASLGGTPAGGLGDAACFSFHPRKSITTGEGGMLTTNRADIADKANMLRNHGASISEEQRHHGPQPWILADFNELGFNYRMTDLQGALGVEQLKRLEDIIAFRETWASFYDEALKSIPWLRSPPRPGNGRHAWQAYVTYVDPAKAPKSRNEIMGALHAMGVSTRPGTHAIHTLGWYRSKFGFNDDQFPGARDCQSQTMAIPLHNKMSPEDFQYVVECLRSFQ
jgi:dTDP-4-amino-4,6-dideoxygalactose transaminase